MDRILIAIGRPPAGRPAARTRAGAALRLRRRAVSAGLLAAIALLAATAGPASGTPLAPEPAIPANGGQGGQFGSSLALSADGSTAAVGAPYAHSTGEVTFFVRSGAAWVQQGPSFAGTGVPGRCPQEPSGEEEACRFGYAVSLSADGSTALVGAPRSRGGRGTAFVFERTGATWALAATLVPSEAGSEPHFGRSVALSADGDEALVGGPGDTRNTGAAWVFSRQGSEWEQTAVLRAGDSGEEGEGFGASVALSGDGATALVGAPGGEGHEGAAWPFTKSEGGWTAGPELASPQLTEGQHFGRSVALSADGATALVGAPGALGKAGDASVFVRSGPGWAPQGPPLGSEEGLLLAGLGSAVALGGGGDVALLGAPAYERRGEVREFGRSGGSWAQLGAGSLATAIEHAHFGETVALSGDAATALVGAPAYEQETGGVWSLAEPFDELAGGKTEQGAPGPTGNEGTANPPPPRLGLAGVLGTITENPPTPTEDRTANLAPTGGTVLVKLPGSSVFVPVTGLLNVPFGTIVDTTKGSATLTTIGPTGKPQTITFYSGVFELVSRGHGKVGAVLSGGNFAVCPSVKHHGHKASVASSHSKHTVRKLWASGHGSYTTQGNYAAGAVQGTKWLTEDKCDGTLIVVVTDEVLVTDLLNHHKKLVKAGHSYFVPAP